MDGTDPPVVGIGHGGAATGPLHGGAVHSVRAAAESQTLGNLPYTHALKLLALPAEEREEFAQEHHVE